MGFTLDELRDLVGGDVSEARKNVIAGGTQASTRVLKAASDLHALQHLSHTGDTAMRRRLRPALDAARHELHGALHDYDGFLKEDLRLF